LPCGLVDAEAVITTPRRERALRFVVEMKERRVRIVAGHAQARGEACEQRAAEMPRDGRWLLLQPRGKPQRLERVHDHQKAAERGECVVVEPRIRRRCDAIARAFRAWHDAFLLLRVDRL